MQVDAIALDNLGVETEIVLEAFIEYGGLGPAIEALDGRTGPRRLEPVGVMPLKGMKKFVADWSLGDAIAPDDAWRPWGRRKRLKHDLARLTAPPPPPPEHLQL